MRRSCSRPARRRAWAAVPLLLLVAAGCREAQGTVSGRVLYNGKPVPGGRVIFRPANPAKDTVFANLNANGEYQAALPAGDVRIAVDNRELEPPEQTQRPQLPPGMKLPPMPKPSGEPAAPSPEAQQKPAGSYVKIPPKYYEVETSDLTYTVTPGDQTKDIELK